MLPTASSTTYHKAGKWQRHTTGFLRAANFVELRKCETVALSWAESGDLEHYTVMNELNPVFILVRAKHCVVHFVYLYLANHLNVWIPNSAVLFVDFLHCTEYRFHLRIRHSTTRRARNVINYTRFTSLQRVILKSQLFGECDCNSIIFQPHQLFMYFPCLFTQTYRSELHSVQQNL